MKLKEVRHIEATTYSDALNTINRSRVKTINDTFSDIWSGLELCNLQMTEREYRRIEKKYYKVNV